MASGDATTSANEHGRYRQRRRTRQGIVDATVRLLQAGHTPSIGDIAEAADVSRRTVYLHFPTLELLLIDATLGLLSQVAIDEAIEAADEGDDVLARVNAMISTMIGQAGESLSLGRALIRLTVDPPAANDAPPGPGTRAAPRRVGWIERALSPIRDQLPAADYERLVSALAMVIGWEAMIILSDLRGLPADEQRETMLWSARALITATLSGGRDD